MENPINVEISKIITELIKDSAGWLLQKAKTLTNQQIKDLSRLLGVGFKPFIESALTRAGGVKTLLYRDRRVPLDHIYVPTVFEQQGRDIEEDNFFEEFDDRNKALLVGTAGSGKSIFIKHAVHRLLERKETIVPIFAELRRMNPSSSSIMHYLLEEIIKPHFPNFEEDDLDKMLKSGSFAVILDGFDEINHDRRDEALQEISFICDRYKSLPLLISTRPDESISGIEELDVYKVQPLSKTSALSLISKLDYDKETKDVFSKALDEKLFKSHRDFSSNPLLLTMLFMTYDQFGEAPARMHTFYNQAFETLFLKHDTLKPHFIRRKYSNLKIEDFRRMYAYFCAVSYFSEEYSFSESRCDELIRSSLHYCEMSENPTNIMNDLIESVCMLQRDGLYITFVHRSFQEYFTAYFLSRVEDMDIYRVVNALAQRGENERCLFLLFDMATERLETRWLFPFAAEQLKQPWASSSTNNIAAFIKTFFKGITIQDDVGVIPGPPTPLYKAVRTAAHFMFPKQPDLASTILRERKYVDTLEANRRINRFFGSRISQFEGKYFEPSSEDNQWLEGSVVETEMQDVVAFLSGVADYADSQKEVRKDKNPDFLSVEHPQVCSVPYSEEFTAKGEITNDDGEKRANERRITRKVYKRDF